MKEINKKEIEQKIRSEYESAIDFCRGDFGRYYVMMVNVFTGNIWSDLFLNSEAHKIYHDEDVIQLEYVPGYASETEEGYINDAIRKLEKAGWTIK